MINLISPSCTTTAYLIADEIRGENGSVDSIPTISKDADGNPYSIALEIQSTQGALLVPRMTAGDIGVLSLCDGMVLYNATTDTFNFRQRGTFKTLGTGTVVGPAVSSNGNIAIFDTLTGESIADSGVNIAAIPPPALLKKEGSLFRENSTVIQLGNLGILQFVGGIGLIFVDSLSPVTFYELSGNVSTIVTGGSVASDGPTSTASVLEIQSDSGGLVLSRLSSSEVSSLPATNGLITYNKDTNQFIGCQDSKYVSIQSNSISSVDLGIGAYNVKTSDAFISVLNSYPNSFQELRMPQNPLTGDVFKVIDSTGNADQNIIFANGNGHDINSDSISYLDSIPVPNQPTVMAITPDGNYLYVSVSDPAGFVGVIKNASSYSASYLKKIAIIGSVPGYFAITPDGKYLYTFRNGDNSISCIYDASTDNSFFNISTYFQLPRAGTSMAMTANGKYLYVSESSVSGKLYIVGLIQIGEPTLVTTVNLSSPTNVAAASEASGGYVLVSRGLASALYLFKDASIGSSTVTNISLSQGQFPGEIALSKVEARGYSCSTNQSSITALKNLNTNSPSEVAVVQTGLPSRSDSILITDNGKYVYAGSSLSGYVSVLENCDTDTPTLMKNIKIGGTIKSLCLSTDGNYVYVTNSIGQVFVISDASGVNPSLLTFIQTNASGDSSLIVPSGKILYTSNPNEDTVSLTKNASSGIVNSQIPFFSSLSSIPGSGGIAFSENGKFGYFYGSGPNVAITENASSISPSSPVTVTLAAPTKGITDGVFNKIGASNYFYAVGVSNANTCSVEVFKNAESTSPTFLTSIPIGSGYLSGSLVLTKNKNYLYASCSDSTISIISWIPDDPDNPFIDSTITVGGMPFQMYLSPNGNNIYVLSSTINKIYVLKDIDVGGITSISATIDVGDAPRVGVFSLNANYFYCLNVGGQNVSVLQNASTNTPSLMQNIALPEMAAEMALSPNGLYLYISGSTALYVIGGIGTSTPSIVNTIPMGASTPAGVEFSKDGKYLYVGTPDGVRIIGNASTSYGYLMPQIMGEIVSNRTLLYKTPNKDFMYAIGALTTTGHYMYNMDLDYSLINSDFGSSTLVFDGGQWVASKGV